MRIGTIGWRSNPPQTYRISRLSAPRNHKSDSARQRRVSDETSLNRSLLQIEDGEVVVSCVASGIICCDELPAGCTFALFRLYVFVIPIRSFVLGFSSNPPQNISISSPAFPASVLMSVCQF